MDEVHQGDIVNFYLWGAWKNRVVKEPFLTKKLPKETRKVVLGDAFIIALANDDTVYSWGRDSRNKCLGLGDHTLISESPQPIEELIDIADIQIGTSHVVALGQNGDVWTWGDGKSGQLGIGRMDNQSRPIRLDHFDIDDRICQIAVVRNSNFAVTQNGAVWVWGDNTDNILGIGGHKDIVEEPVRLNLLDSIEVDHLEIIDNCTVIAHARTRPDEDEDEDVAVVDENELDQEILTGIEEMSKTMKMVQGWWIRLLNIRHGQPYETLSMNAGKLTGVGALQEDLDADSAKLDRANEHVSAYLAAAMNKLQELQTKPCTKSMRWILCLFIDECKLRKEKIQRIISAKSIVEAKRQAKEINLYSVTDFSDNATEDMRRLIAATNSLQGMLKGIRKIKHRDVTTQQFLSSVVECVELKLQLCDTQVDLIQEKIQHGTASDTRLPALRIIQDRWAALKNYSLYALYNDAGSAAQDEGETDEDLLKRLVQTSNTEIDKILEVDRDKMISMDTLLPALCYDLLRENAELRKMANSYQLHVLMVVKEKAKRAARAALDD